MLCAISGEAPQVPVASRKSGNVFERRLIEAHIAEHHTDPVSGEDLEVEDLIELKTPRIQRPRPPTLTSIPSLLSSLQNEWDAIALETYELQKQLAQTRQELSTALYQNDAANRVIARLMRERDEARDALSKITVSGGAAPNGDAMQVDSQPLPEELVAKIQTTLSKLQSTRKKRPVPEDWATSEVIESFNSVDKTEALYPGGRTLALDSTGDLAIVGGTDGVAGVYSISQKTVLHTLKAGGAVTAGVWWDSKAVIGTSTGSVKIFEEGQEIADLGSHAGSAIGVYLHPSGEILASIGVDRSYKLYDLATLRAVSQVYSETELTCAAFHPDGALFAAGTQSGQIKVWQVESGAEAATFDEGRPVQAICFSENGYWVASAGKGETVVNIWDLRKANVAKTLDVGSAVESLAWDYTGQFLAIAGPGSLSVQQYSKSSKSWSEPLKKAVAAKAVQWGPQAKSLVILTPEGGLEILGPA